jgi:hypothetical protein
VLCEYFSGTLLSHLDDHFIHFEEIMKHEEHRWVEASCDACGADLLFPTCGDHANCNYASLEHHFGYGSDFDILPEPGRSRPRFDLCQECFRKVIELLGLEPELEAQSEETETPVYGRLDG